MKQHLIKNKGKILLETKLHFVSKYSTLNFVFTAGIKVNTSSEQIPILRSFMYGLIVHIVIQTNCHHFVCSHIHKYVHVIVVSSYNIYHILKLK